MKCTGAADDNGRQHTGAADDNGEEHTGTADDSGRGTHLSL